MSHEIPVVFHKRSNKFLAKFECLGENTKKYKCFSAPIEKEIRNIDKYGNESVVTLSYKIKFIDSARFMATSLSNLVDNLTEGLNKF